MSTKVCKSEGAREEDKVAAGPRDIKRISQHNHSFHTVSWVDFRKEVEEESVHGYGPVECDFHL